MPQTKKILIGRTQVTLYTVDQRNWFSSPRSLIETRKRLNAERVSLRSFWQYTGCLEGDDILPLPVEQFRCGGMKW
jgi:hypothetical protein